MKPLRVYALEAMLFVEFLLSELKLIAEKINRRIVSVEIGDLAPDFELPNQNGELVQLSSFRGVKPVVLVFYPLSFSGTCTGELCELRDNFSSFQTQEVELLAISVDSKYVQKQYAEQENYEFDVLADFWPHGEVAMKYGVFLEDKGFANRGTFLVDKDGKIAAKFVTTPGEPRPLSRYMEALASL
jgi:peroxiredoxin